ncbi:hypothetical protein Syun_018819 [Stephania yunnanensis]|uniref:Ribulose bisphosphate carboxylase large chain n=1 Tax=Stephania yunnanensis TaxID=152371 RepID=A0AAP0IUW3_9MAGN
MKQQLVSYRSGHKLESLDQFERSFDVVEITKFRVVRSSNGNSMEFITISMEGLMSPQIETKASVRFKAGAKDYKLTYYTPKYETEDTDTLATFRVTPQPGVPPEEAGFAVTIESLQRTMLPH